jgi:predicted transcriptional regulator
VKLVVGEAEVSRTLCGTPEVIWEMTAEFSGISKTLFEEYYGNTDTAVAFELKNIVRYGKGRDLSEYGIKSPPQSFAYVPDD